MLEEIVKDFKSIVTDYQSIIDPSSISNDMQDRHARLAAKCVIGTMRLLVGYDESVMRMNRPFDDVLTYLEYIRMDVYEELIKEGITFRYVFENGLLYGRLVDSSEVMAMYPVTTVQQAPVVGRLIDKFQIRESTIH